jgi:hypothetical protein
MMLVNWLRLLQPTKCSSLRAAAYVATVMCCTFPPVLASGHLGGWIDQSAADSPARNRSDQIEKDNLGPNPPGFIPSLSADGVITFSVSDPKDQSRFASFWSFEGQPFCWPKSPQGVDKGLGGANSSATVNGKYFVSSPEGIGNATTQPFDLSSNIVLVKLRLIGGSDISQTYAALDIDGAEQFRVAASGSLTRSVDVIWNVSKYSQSKSANGGRHFARLRLVDKSTREGIGLVAELAAVNASETIGSEPIRFGTGLIGHRPYFLRHSSYFTDEEIDKGKSYPYGVAKPVVKALINEVCTRMFSGKIPYEKGREVDDVARDILREVDQTLANAGIKNSPRFLRQSLCAEAISAWVRSEFDADPAAGNQSVDEWWNSMNPRVILNQSAPVLMCSTSANLTRYLANALTKETGLRCRYISGWFRSLETGFGPSGTSNHSWPCFLLEGGIQMPADNVPTGEPKSVRRTWKGKHGGPLISNLSWEAFLAFHWGFETPALGKSDPQIFNPDPLTSLTHDQWSKIFVPWSPGYKDMYVYLETHPFGE